MKPSATDAVRIKDEIQAALTREYRGLSEKEIARRRLGKLLASNDSIACLWRSAVAEPRSRALSPRRRRPRKSA